MKTEGIQYVGSKRVLINTIISIVDSLPDIKTVIDGFSGTTRVSQALKQNENIVICNDISIYSKIFAECYLLNKKPKKYYDEIIEYLNVLKPEYGWYSENYGGQLTGDAINEKNGKKMVWQIHNTMKLDVIRDEIDKITTDNIERSVLITSLINALDKTSNTMGHQVSYLKKWAKKTNNIIKLSTPSFILNDLNHLVYRKDIFDIKNTADLAYIDPPYGTNNVKMPSTRVRYSSYYHLWTTICLNDKPKLVGKANRREDASNDKYGLSIFENVNEDEVINAIIKLIDSLNTRYILFSYNNKGRVSIEHLKDIFGSNLLETYIFDHKKNVMANSTITNEWSTQRNSRLQEYMFLVKK